MFIINDKKYYNKNFNTKFENIYKVIQLNESDLNRNLFKNLWENTSSSTINKLEIINEIVNQYLSIPEKKLFNLFYLYNKTPTEIYRILKYKTVYKTIWAVNVKLNKLFSIINLFYFYNNINRTNLVKLLNKNFTFDEIYILQLLEKRHILFKIIIILNKKNNRKKIKYKWTYWKLFIKIKDIKNKLKNSNEEDLIKYLEFINKIKKFKKISKSDQKIENDKFNNRLDWV